MFPRERHKYNWWVTWPAVYPAPLYWPFQRKTGTVSVSLECDFYDNQGRFITRMTADHEEVYRVAFYGFFRTGSAEDKLRRSYEIVLDRIAEEIRLRGPDHFGRSAEKREPKGLADTSQAAAVSDVDVNIPETAHENTDAVAVIIGNKDYRQYHADVPDVEFAINDAETVKRYVESALGYREGNVLYYPNATNSTFRSVFGTKEVREGQLAYLVKPGKSDVFVYYRGHGAPDITTREGYFVPVDCAPDDVRLNGYPLSLFYENLGSIDARSFTIVIDACFTGGSPEGMLVKAASPVGIRVTNPALTLKNGIVLTSSSADEISSWYPEQSHGLFTYFFLRALQGEADVDMDGSIRAREVFDYLADRSEGVPYWARRLYRGRSQNPSLFGDSDRVILDAERWLLGCPVRAAIPTRRYRIVRQGFVRWRLGTRRMKFVR